MTVSFDVREIPFSSRGSWLDISPVVALHTSAADLHVVSHTTGMHAVLRLVPELYGVPVETVWTATPSTLSWDGDGVHIEAAFDSVDVIRLHGDASLRILDAASVLTPFSGTFLFRDPIDGSAVFTSYETGRRYRVSSVRGELDLIGAEALGQTERAVIASGPDGWEIAIEEFETARPPYASERDFAEIVAASAEAFDGYLESVAGWRTDAAPAADRAGYVLWSATVAPAGFLARESILMSKHWMDKVWSWDHCFNALALADGLPSEALDQFFTPFDHQEASGAMPDSVTHSEVLYNYVKPPIHGWAFAKLRAAMHEPLDDSTLGDAYRVLSRWTRFWLDSRRVANHALAHYQHGNDSGWDNSTTFDLDRVIESPDLAAFLVVQLDVLADLADELGSNEADGWRTEADAILTALLGELWDGDRFTARAALGGRTSKHSSLLNLLPILAAGRLPIDVRERLAASISDHLTEFGLATEPPASPDYESDGYWRGPIWAPSTVLIEDGLRRAGFVELADVVSERFRALCELSGFAENFDALSGEGLRDRAYTWTASAYLLLAKEAQLRS